MRLLALGIVIGGSFAPLAPAVTVDDFVARTYTSSAGTLPYRLFIPTNYNPATKYPLVLFLHGSGERGSDNRLQLTGQTGPLVFAADANQKKNPSFMVAPQCPLNGYWTDSIQPAQVLGMMNALMAEFSVDADRVYITGLSMGGYGTWDYITEYPQMYAAAVPMNGGGNTAVAGRITHIPIWNFHAADDSVVPVSESRLIVQAVRRAGGNVIYAEYLTGGHAIWTPAYGTPILMDWVYSQKRGTFSSAPPLLKIVSPTDEPLYSLNGTNLSLSGLATNDGNRVTAVAWTNYSAGVASGLAQGTTNWSATNISVNPSVTNWVLVIARGTILSPPLGAAPTTFNDMLAVIVPPSITGQPASRTVYEGDTAVFSVLVPGYVSSPSYQWFFNYTNAVSGATTNSDLVLTDVQFSDSGVYRLVITNAFGAITTAPAMLNVIAPVERRTVPAIHLTGEAGNSLTVEYCDALGHAANWMTLGTVTLTSTSQFDFDLSEPLPPQRFYRAWQTGAPGVIPSLDLHLVPAITLTGNINDSLRLDYINAFGPTDAWVTLDTVTLTNTSQFYFDVSCIGQPLRFYRIVPAP